MRKKINSILVIFLVLTLSLVSYLGLTLYEKTQEINSMYSSEVYASMSVQNVKNYREVMKELDQIPGVLVSNSRYTSDEQADNIFYVDKSYYNNFFNNLQFIDGNGFNSNDFTYIFDGSSSIPAIVTDEYVENNNLKVGDRIQVKDSLPTTCDLYTDWSSIISLSDGTEVETKYESPKEYCVEDNSYDYLEDENYMTSIPIEIIGIVSKDSLSLIDNHSSEDLIIIPDYIVNDKNMHLYDLDAYLKGNPIYTNFMDGQWVFVDYSVISPQLFEVNLENIEEKYDTPINIYSDILTANLEMEEFEGIYLQLLISTLYILLILFILWVSNSYYNLKYKEYSFSIFYLLGFKWYHIMYIEIKNRMFYDLIEFVILMLVLSIIHIESLLIIGVITYVLIKLLYYISIVLKYKLMLRTNLSAIYNGGEL